MRKPLPLRHAAYALFALMLAAVPVSVAGQDYAMFEVQRVSALPGSTADIGIAMYEHNQLFHADAPYAGSVFYMATGKDSGQYQWVMGPTTFSQIGDRPLDAAHTSDWANRVAANAEVHETEYWVRVDELSYTPDGMPAGQRPISVARRFQVTDAALFQRVQEQVMAVTASLGSPNPRIMYRRRFISQDGWDWAAITSYESYTGLDGAGPTTFQEGFVALYGDGAWATFLEDVGEAVTAREDVLRELITGM